MFGAKYYQWYHHNIKRTYIIHFLSRQRLKSHNNSRKSRQLLGLSCGKNNHTVATRKEDVGEHIPELSLDYVQFTVQITRELIAMSLG